MRNSLGQPPPYMGPNLTIDTSTTTPDIALITPQIPLARNRQKRSRFFDRLRRFWIKEILLCGVGLGCGAIILVVLARYDGKISPQWPLGITLNTFLAFFATIAKAAFLIPVTSGLGQLRWMWFKRPRRADDFELFEGATRGAFGSIWLLVSLKGGFLGFLAAVVMVASMMVSTVTQGAVDYRSRPYPSNAHVEVPRITVFDTDKFFMDGTDDNYQRILNMKQHVTAGAYTPATQKVPPDPIQCPTGDCQFPDFVTVGVCSDVADITSQLKTARLPPRQWPNMPGLPSNQTWSAALPAGQNLTIPTVFAFDFFLVLDLAPSLAFQHLKPQTFGNIFMIYSNVLNLDDPNQETTVSFNAVEMVWYWCAKSYSVNVTSGITHFTQLSQSSTITNNTTTAPVNMPLNLNFILCVFELTPTKCEESLSLKWGNLTLSPPPGFTSTKGPTPALVVNELSSLSLSAFLTMSFWNGVRSPLELASTSEGDISRETSGMFMALGRKFFRIQGDLSMAFAINLYRDFGGAVGRDGQLAVLKSLVANVAGGLENFIRSDWKAHTRTSGPVKGTVFVETTFVSIRWPWLAYLLVELALSSLFLMAIIIWTTVTRTETLGSSSLATLCALDGATKQSLGHIGDYEGLRGRARGTYLQLIDGPEGLVLKEHVNGIGKGF